MKERKFLAVLLLIIMTATLTVGCTQEEKDFIDLHNEISQLKVIENNGEITVHASEFPAVDPYDEVENPTSTLLSKGLTVKYTGKANLEQQLLDYTFFYVDPDTGVNVELTRVLCKDNTLYFKIDTLLELFGGAEEFSSVFGNREYISITTDEYVQLYGATVNSDLSDLFDLYNTIYGDGFMNKHLFSAKQKFINGLPDAYPNFSTGMITKSGNKYTLEATGTNLTELFLDTLEYSINNIAVIGNFSSNFLKSLNEEELALFTLTPENISMCEALITMAVAEVQMGKDELIGEIEDMRQELSTDQEVGKIMDSISFAYSIEKTGEQQYQNSMEFLVDIEEYGEKLNMQLRANNNVQGIASFSVNVPTNVLSFNELAGLGKKSMEVDVDNNYYYYENMFGFSETSIDVKIIKGRTYLPMRAVAEKFGEEVVWDANAGKAYIMKNGSQIDMTGMIFNDRTYIKIRDFEKIGYQVTWYDDTRLVSLIAPPQL